MRKWRRKRRLHYWTNVFSLPTSKAGPFPPICWIYRQHPGLFLCSVLCQWFSEVIHQRNSSAHQHILKQKLCGRRGERGELPPFLLFRQLKFIPQMAAKERALWGQMWLEKSAFICWCGFMPLQCSAWWGSYKFSTCLKFEIRFLTYFFFLKPSNEWVLN